MSNQSRLAVELTKGDDFLNIWVDANNNGVRDDDDVNIFVTKSGNFFAESPTFKDALDSHLKNKLREASIALMTAGHDTAVEEQICELAFELVVKACTTAQASIAAQDASMEQQPANAEFTELGIPIYRPQA